MTPTQRIDAQLTELSSWKADIIARLRALIHAADPDITEEWKWNNPAWSHAGLICGVFTAAEWVHFRFYQGALLTDTHGVFNDSLDAQAARVIKFRQGDPINDDALKDLVRQAVANNLAGRKIVAKPEPQQEIILPPYIRDALRDHGLTQAFDDRPYYQRKHWPEWTDAAKQETTRQKRLATMLHELTTGEYMAPKNK